MARSDLAGAAEGELGRGGHYPAGMEDEGAAEADPEIGIARVAVEAASDHVDAAARVAATLVALGHGQPACRGVERAEHVLPGLGERAVGDALTLGRSLGLTAERRAALPGIAGEREQQRGGEELQRGRVEPGEAPQAGEQQQRDQEE
jgi:hypothetical protein